jgi:hypothetical protein
VKHQPVHPAAMRLRCLAALAILAFAPSALPALEVGDAVEMSPAAYQSSKRALAYLAATQREDGAWPGDQGGTDGIVASCCLAFLSAGQVPGRGEFGVNAARAIEFLIKTSQPNGLLYRQGMPGFPMYHHGLATLCLAEAWGMTQDKAIRDTVKRAVELIVSTQNEKGGWRYQPRVADDDLSVTVMQLMALRAAKDAGIYVPKDVIDSGIEYVKRCHNGKDAGKDGGFAYQPGGESGFARTGAGVLSLQVAGNYRAKEVSEGVEYLMTYKPVGTKEQSKEHYFYGLYYSSMGIYQSQSAGEWGRRAWNAFYPAITRSLIAEQQPDGHWNGSFEQYATAMAILVLDIPFRYLPIYQR